MSENQIEVNDNRKKHLGRFVELLPDLSKGFMAVAGEAYKDGVIDSSSFFAKQCENFLSL